MRLEAVRHELQLSSELLLVAARCVLLNFYGRKKRSYHHARFTVHTLDDSHSYVIQSPDPIPKQLFCAYSFDKGDNDSPYRIGKAIVSSTNTSGKADETSKHCGVSNLNPTLKTDIANKLLSLVEQYRAHWLSRLKQY